VEALRGVGLALLETSDGRSLGVGIVVQELSCATTCSTPTASISSGVLAMLAAARLFEVIERIGGYLCLFGDQIALRSRCWCPLRRTKGLMRSVAKCLHVAVIGSGSSIHGGSPPSPE
jgi:hypothetical protein